jgi:hypothetical protein
MPPERGEPYPQVVILRIRVFRVIAVLAIGSAVAAVIPGSAAGAASPPRVSVRSADISAPGAGRPGSLSGIVIDSHHQVVPGVCVTASRIAGSPAGRTTVTSASGMFMIADLRGGGYFLRYRDCLNQPGKVVSPRATALGPGALAAPVTATRGLVTGGHVTFLGHLTLRSRAAARDADRAAALPYRPAVRMVTAAQLRHRFSGQHFGGVAGRVLGPHGRPIKGLCFNVNFRHASLGGPVRADGRYSTGKDIPPGRYTVDFTAGCNGPFGTATANWAPEWYHGKLHQSGANPVVVRASTITRGIDDVMRPGGVIEGTVTGHSGAGLAKVCVAAVSHGIADQEAMTPRDGRYRLQGLSPGRYNIAFFPNCLVGGAGRYLPQWWPGTPEPTKRGLIKTGVGTTRAHLDARLVLGGTISGTVRLRNRHGRPIKGICVSATPTNQVDGDGFIVGTNAEGRYAIHGLAAGRFAVNFSTGCNSNGNFLSQNYPHSVTVRLSKVTGGINAYLQPGAVVTGTVTAKAGGAPLRGICVVDAYGDSDAETGPDGTYVLNQLTPGTHQIQFFNCDNKASLAPQFYPGQLNSVNATSLRVSSGQVVKGINAALTPGATISGTVTMSTGAKPDFVCVEADPVALAGNLGGGAVISPHGHYVISDLPPDTYQVGFSSCGDTNIVGGWFGGPGRPTGNESRAALINLAAGGTVSGIEAVLRFAGSISGSISGPARQRGSFVCLGITSPRTPDVASDGFGLELGSSYSITGLAPGRYLLDFVPCNGQNLAAQWYNGATRSSQATPVVVRAQRNTGKISTRMTVGGLITGRVVSKVTGKPLGGVCVGASGTSQPFFGFGATDRSGKYVVAGLSSTAYRLFFTSCGPPGLVPLVSAAVRATAGKTVTGPNVAMLPVKPGAITGTISAAGPAHQPVGDACLDAVPAARGILGELEAGTGATGRHGQYKITDLLPGKYDVFIGDGACETAPDGLVPQWYLGASRMTRATPVSVVAGRVTPSISVTLQRDGPISGTVTGPKPAASPLAGICVQAVPVARVAAPYLAESAAGGGYQTGALPPGRYRVEFSSGCGATGYATQWWRGAGSTRTATLVTVRAGQEHSGISATMKRTTG